ncbi:hypothetical protein ND16A_0181 [Thalassotalea sp. ND16A]|nr:hypothetical protein ND16A_0181 [Thalassotalea sp. ND16A]
MLRHFCYEGLLLKTVNPLLLKTLILVLLVVISFSVFANAGDWYLKPSIGVTAFDDSDANLNSMVNVDEKVKLETDPGLTYGIGLGYFFTDDISLELSYSFFENDSDFKAQSDSNSSKGDIRVSYVTLNSYWHVQRKGNFRPYLGIGGGITTDSELNINTDQNDLSLSNDGDLVFQLMMGLDFEINRQLAFLTEIKYTNIELTDLNQASADQQIDDLQHNPFTLQVALLYSF